MQMPEEPAEMLNLIQPKKIPAMTTSSNIYHRTVLLQFWRAAPMEQHRQEQEHDRSGEVQHLES